MIAIIMKIFKYISLALMLFYSIMLKAQTFEMNYSHFSEPFKWTITKIEGKDKSTFIYLKVKNTAYDKRVLNFSDGEFAITKSHPKGVKSSHNSIVANKHFNLILNPGEETRIILQFPSLSIINSKIFAIKIARHFTLNQIIIPGLTLSDVNNQMQTWEQFYFAHREIVPEFANENELKIAIQKKVENWQKKDEFESTNAWKERVNDHTREEFIKKTTDSYINQYQTVLNQIKAEQQTLSVDYEAYKENLLNQFYNHKIAIATNLFDPTDFEIYPYDADHETFMIHSSQYGDILLPVPINDAPSFKQNWSSIKPNITPQFVPNGDSVALSKLIFTNNSKKFIYDSHTVANYAITDIKYNFSPIEIADIDVNNIHIDNFAAIPNGVSSTVVGKVSSDILTTQKVQTGRINVSASEKSNVDIAIPQNKTDNNTSTFAIIIANEQYHSISNVQYATKDGEILKEYLTCTVGLPQDHVKIYKNASFGNMLAALKYIENLSEAFGDELNLIFYYAGHGMPNEKTKKPMLIPVDGDVALPETCYELDKVITTLGGLNANSVLVILDACFCGTERGDEMLMAARGIRIKTSQSAPIGNMVIFSASQGDETAYSFDTEQHGMFTYFLLKKLQETNGDVTLGELSDYITEQVKRQSVISNGKLQTPSISVSSTIQTLWRNHKLK